MTPSRGGAWWGGAETALRTKWSQGAGVMRGAELVVFESDRREAASGLARGVAAYFAQRRVMRGGGRCGSGEERSAGAASGAAVEGTPLGKAATATGTTPHYTALCECQPSTTRDQAVWWMPGSAAVNRLPRQRLVFAG
jgi:hypothetical protein